MALPKAPVPLPKWDKADAYALQAMWAGTATPEQQQRGMKWIVEIACDTYGFPDKPDNDRLSTIWLGRTFVGKQITKLVKINLSLLPKEED